MKIEQAIKQDRFNDEYHKLFLNLLYTAGWLNIRQIQFFKQYDLSPQQFNILRILRGQYPNPASVNLLIERMLDKMSNASRLVDKLDAKGLVERRKCAADKRQVDVAITKKGMKLLEQIDKEIGNLDNMVGSLSKQEAKTMNELLDKMRG
ncbi:MAG TPA: MarR family transcriptional regulator [Chitinophagales bacterium]|nr:MarR family transcriptional regulator [Chitinophagales bacterium]